ncbi:hypothetical protein PPL_08782 [Heterostelium album PN500]|uniref:Uncharacterized protein n=1 Tax=Heterostelium pallidum (strain ATCC 26659 / Pp 5 / PN500) TaxID=670386 RepID=D3BJQ3_HETP5|nr:hypothetical protein PPL_08782 [Heterostelium album PN500]EFA78133.1 hypothetical protein PPL_08782 [Heterostelium album PN500]|eukprot:XP_020430259.1 hypothetical protein PPL_08782 [Heterostelium album PN500]
MSQYFKNMSSDVKSISFDVTGKHDSFKPTNEFDYGEDFRKEQFKTKMEKPNQVPLMSSIDSSDKKNHLYIGPNSFVKSCILAYSDHHRIVLRPDDIWISIMTQFSFYLNANSEQLREKLVDFQGKKELTVSANASLFSAPYDDMTLAMTDLIAKNIKDPSIRDWSMPSFSTTTYNDRIVGAVCLMATMKNFFQFKYQLCCGLPSVTLLGSVEDWKSLKDKAQRLVEFDVGEQKLMSKWSAMLLPILDQFIQSVNGKPDISWWNRIANYVGGGSGPTWLSGWITAFTVFSPEGVWLGDKKKIFSMNDATHLTSFEWCFIDTQDMACGFVELDKSHFNV